MSDVTGIRVIKPIALTNQMLVSSSVPENDYPLWLEESTYLAGSRVTRVETHHNYEALVDGQDYTFPENATTGITPRWLDLGATNRWKAFDKVVNSITVGYSPMSYTFNVGGFNSFALLNLSGFEATISLASNGVQVYDRSFSLSGRKVHSWYDFFMTPKGEPPEAISATDLSKYLDGVVTITLKGNGLVSCGVCIFGDYVYIGLPQLNYRAGITDYSIKDTDVYGNVTLMARDYSKHQEFSALLLNKEISLVFKSLVKLRATPCVWIPTGNVKYDFLMIYGYYKDFEIDIQYATASICTLQIEGLI